MSDAIVEEKRRRSERHRRKLIGLEAVPALDALENEEVRAARRELDVGRAADEAENKSSAVLRLGFGSALGARNVAPFAR
ncbi:MAG: hypothetical protein ABSC22_13835 [Roseiarcus sp.]|jgi:hypothetical protein